MPKRTCGSCTACCSAMLVEELNKPDWQKCEHQWQFGCRIYGHRPEGCRLYKCMWLAGQGNKRWRPDRKGVLISGLESPGGLPHFLIHELRPGALKQSDVIKVVVNLCKEYPVFEVLRDTQLRLVGGPNHLVKEFMDERTAGGNPPQYIPETRLTARLTVRNK